MNDPGIKLRKRMFGCLLASGYLGGQDEKILVLCIYLFWAPGWAKHWGRMTNSMSSVLLSILQSKWKRLNLTHRKKFINNLSNSQNIQFNVL